MSKLWQELKARPKVFPWPIRVTPHKALVIAHRGASFEAPENTLIAFQRAIAMEADMIELDVRLSLDEEVVVFHDSTLKRTTDKEGKVRDMPLATLKQADAGSWFNPAFTGERIPTLEETLQLCQGKIMLNIEIKKESVRKRDALIERKIIALLHQYQMVPHTMISSFSTLALKRLKELEPRLSTALLYGDSIRSNLRPKVPVYGYQAFKWVLLTGADALNPRQNLVTRGFLKRSQETGIRLNPYTVDSPRRMQKLITKGVHGLITNRPDLLIKLLRPQAPARKTGPLNNPPFGH